MPYCTGAAAVGTWRAFRWKSCSSSLSTVMRRIRPFRTGEIWDQLHAPAAPYLLRLSPSLDWRRRFLGNYFQSNIENLTTREYQHSSKCKRLSVNVRGPQK